MSTAPRSLLALGVPIAPTRGPGEDLARLIGDTAASALVGATLPVRGVVLGPAGSGKTAALDALRAELRARGLTVADRADAPAEHVVVLDDAHALDDAALEAASACVDDPDRSIVVAYRDHAAPPRLRALAARLEKTTAPVLLGTVEVEQIAEATRVPLACAHAIIRRTQGLTWLTLAALDAHDSGTCELDPEHRDLARGLRGGIAHRLAQVPAAARDAVEALCLFPPAEIAAQDPPEIGWDDAIEHGHAVGLLAVNGSPPSIVRAAVRASLPVHRITRLLALAHIGDDDEWDEDATASAPDRLQTRGDAVRADDPARALQLYREALVAGAAPSDLALRFGVAAFGTGDLDTAAAGVDRLLAHPEHPDRDDAQSAAAAVWAARGALAAGAPAAAPAVSAVSAARRALIDLGVGRRPQTAPAGTVADTLTVASDALTAALRGSLGLDVARAVDDLVLASELYSASRCDFPLVEPPAVVAAAAAMATGDLGVAASVLESAVDAGQGGAWARPRLRLWRAWVAIAAARPDEARSHLDAARDTATALQPRDRLIEAACETALARRYANTATLLAVFRDARPHLLRRRFDAYLLPFLGELMLAAVRVGAADAVDRHFDAAVEGLAALEDPPLWSPLLHWAGIQRGILLNRPELLVPHARALLAAAAHSPFAARLAEAGHVWTDVLGGTVEPLRVEAAAHALAHDGLAWDGARLAAHGAARTGDRQAYAQLLACARELHPKQVLQPEAVRPEATAPLGDGTPLSARELDVARLVVQGKTYVEIGQTLFISPRTAEHHIARIRRRLDANSRSELLTKLRDVLHSDDPTGREGAA
ncbi:DNA-binding CsgD family transcriptional regulator [Microbacterium telephonicum]|uniref:DNA-binding CsgD family transcriptional regulator n=2 Tax=Microbacterium telephonicum TaxID=1714841 RepID=A0A498BX54_9MICO|nr:DNA-binding CsgD family transcriptional regulator [Microbacterium telephonicum]